MTRWRGGSRRETPRGARAGDGVGRRDHAVEGVTQVALHTRVEGPRVGDNNRRARGAELVTRHSQAGGSEIFARADDIRAEQRGAGKTAGCIAGSLPHGRIRTRLQPLEASANETLHGVLELARAQLGRSEPIARRRRQAPPAGSSASPGVTPARSSITTPGSIRLPLASLGRRNLGSTLGPITPGSPESPAVRRDLSEILARVAVARLSHCPTGAGAASGAILRHRLRRGRNHSDHNADRQETRTAKKTGNLARPVHGDILRPHERGAAGRILSTRRPGKLFRAGDPGNPRHPDDPTRRSECPGMARPCRRGAPAAGRARARR